jgi:DNA-binding HxlR family transcriptional regulator
LGLKLRQPCFTKYDIALFIDETGKTRWFHLLKKFVENGSERHISRQQLSNYLKELVDEGLVQKTVDPQALMLRMVWRVYPIYVVPKNRKKRLQEIREKRDIYEFIDSADSQRIKKLHEEIKRLAEEKDEIRTN